MTSQSACSEPSPHRPDAHDASAQHSAEERQRNVSETLKLITIAARDLAARIAAPQPPDAAPLIALDRLKQDLRAAVAGLTAGGARAAREQQRFVCDALRLHRACARATCRKAQRCRGNPDACCARAAVPQPVLEGVVGMLLIQQLPWLSERVAERTAYDAWIAGIEAGARR